MYTEGVNPRTDTEPVSVDRAPDEQERYEEEDNIYLLEILSRLLHLIPLNSMPQKRL